MNTLLIDIDDTVLRWIDGFEDWMREEYGVTPNEGVPKNPYKICERLGYSVPVVGAYVGRFNRSANFGSLPYFPYAEDTLFALKKSFNLVALTSCGDDEGVQERRRDQIGHLFDEIHFFPLMTDKSLKLREYADRALFFLDDSKTHINAALGMGILSYKFDPYAHMGEPYTITCWSQVYRLACLLKEDKEHMIYENRILQRHS